MDFGAIIGRGKKVDKAFEELQTTMATAVEESMALDEASLLDDAMFRDGAAEESEPSPDSELGSADTDLAGDISANGAGKAAPQLTSHTQNRLAALSSFEKFYVNAQQGLQEIGTKLMQVKTLHGSVGELIAVLHAEIQRSNELELANSALLAEHRGLWEQFQDSSRQHQEREGLLDRLQQREATLIHDNEALRSALATAKLELVETSNTNTRNETELADLAKTLSARTAETERRARENEALREKNIGLSIELDKAMNREAELRHKLDETSKIHANEASRNSDLLGALAKSEKEALRVQKALDAALSNQAALRDSARVLEADRESEMKRSAAEMRGLRSELHNLHARLEQAMQESSATVNEVAELKIQLSDAVAERHVAGERLAALMKDSELDRLNLATANANLSEIALRQASEQIQLDVRIQECEDLRAEIAALNAQIKELLPYERLHRVTQARQREGAGSVVDFTSATVDPKRGGGRRPNGSGRRHAV